MFQSGRGMKRQVADVTAKQSKNDQALKFHLNEKSPLSITITGEHNMECRSSLDFKLESRKRFGSNNYQFKETATENSVAISLLIFLHRMMNKKQLTITLISFICAIYAIYIGISRNSSIYGYESRHHNAYTIKHILLAYGLVQLLLSIIFFLSYATTKEIGQSKWCCQIIRFTGCIIYLLVAFFVLLIGIIGFYWVIKLYDHVEYEDRQSVDYVDVILYKTSLFTFSFHICFVILKCCWWNQ